MDQCRIQIEEAKEMLEKKIPEEANLYEAKPEWVKQRKNFMEIEKNIYLLESGLIPFFKKECPFREILFG